MDGEMNYKTYYFEKLEEGLEIVNTLKKIQEIIRGGIQK